jgi:hypothetical protein
MFFFTVHRYSETSVMHFLFSLLRIKGSTCFERGPDSSVGISTDYGLDSPGTETRWEEIFRKRLDLLWGPPSLLYNGYRVFYGGKAAGAWC